MQLHDLKRRLLDPVKMLSLKAGISAALARRQRAMRIIMFHGVDMDGEPSAAEFFRLFDFLQQHFRIVSLHDVLARVRGEKSIDGDEVAITFDDGYASFGSKIYPVLVERRLPATVFVCPALIDRNAIPWTYEIRARLAAMPPEAWRTLGERWPEAPRTPDALILWIRNLAGGSNREEIVNAIRTLTADFELLRDFLEAHTLMDWETLNRLDHSLITVGSHGMQHRALPGLTEKELRYEVVTSASSIREKLDTACRFFCYPMGRWDDMSKTVVAEHHEAAVVTAKGLVRTGDDPILLTRIGTSSSCARFAWKMWRPAS